MILYSSEICVICTNLVVRTPKDGRGISQKQVLEQNLSSTDVHGRTLFNSATDGGGSKQKRVRTANSSLNSVQGCTLFNSLFQKAYGKRILYNSFYGIYSFV